jgi:succinoglycan biosynthesis protein ExoL
MMEAAQSPAKVEFICRGYPNHEVQGEFERLRKKGVITYLGPYRYPDDLSLIYSGVDLIWALDFSAPQGNSRWLLSNRNYEAGFYAVPQLVLADTEAARFVEANELGWVVAEPVEESLVTLFEHISAQDISQKSKEISRGDPARFLAEPDLKGFGERLADAAPHLKEVRDLVGAGT